MAVDPADLANPQVATEPVPETQLPAEEVVFVDAKGREPRISSDAARANLQKYFDDAEIGDDGKKKGWDWYNREHDHIEKAARAPGVNTSPEKFAGMVAALSPRMKWEQNIPAAQRAARLSSDHPEIEDMSEFVATMDKPGMLRANLMKAIRIHRGEDIPTVLGNKKTYNFHHNLVDPDGTGDMVTIDVWMQRALLGGRNPTGKEEKYLSKPGYEWGADIVRQIAHDLDYTPQQVQAIIWTEVMTKWPKVLK